MAKYLVFLDIDGVFTSNRVHIAHNGEYEMWSKFDPIAIDFMNYIHDTYPVEFVLMSSWRNLLGDISSHVMFACFASAGFRGMFANQWKTSNNARWRGEQVKEYLDQYGQDIEDYILFDDDDEYFEKYLQTKRLIRTDANDGLLFKHMLKAKSLMGNWEKK